MRLATTALRRAPRGSALIEIAMAYAALVVVALLALKASVNTAGSQAWTVKQSMTDAYITREMALASRIPFDLVTGDGSPWPLHPSTATAQIEVGKLPGGAPVTVEVHRTRVADENNPDHAGGSGTETTNPAGTEAWKLQSIISYEIADRQYVKTRTVLRVR